MRIIAMSLAVFASVFTVGWFKTETAEAPPEINAEPGRVPGMVRRLGHFDLPGILNGEGHPLLEASDAGTRLAHGDTLRGVLNFLMDMTVLDTSFLALNEALKAQAEEPRWAPAQRTITD